MHSPSALVHPVPALVLALAITVERAIISQQPWILNGTFEPSAVEASKGKPSIMFDADRLPLFCFVFCAAPQYSSSKVYSARGRDDVTSVTDRHAKFRKGKSIPKPIV